MEILIVGLVSVLVAWLACGYTAAAMHFAFFQRNWPSLAVQDLHKDRNLAWHTFIFGPIALLVACILRDYQHGLIWDWPSCVDTSRKGA